MVSIIDYDAGNIKSVEKAIQFLGQKAVITKDRDVILSSDHVILPGVGSFGDAMGKLKEYKLDSTIYDVVDKGIPFLGICLGLQLLYESSEESPGVSGLGVLKGRILRIPDAPGIKIPHMGWNSLLFIHIILKQMTSRKWLHLRNILLQFMPVLKKIMYLHVSSIRKKAVR